MLRSTTLVAFVLAAGVAGFAPARPSAFARRVATRAPLRTSRARALGSQANDDGLENLFSPEPELSGAFTLAQPLRRAAAPALSSSLVAPFVALRRYVNKVYATVLCALLSAFFFGSPAIAASKTLSATRAVPVASAAVLAIPPAVGMIAAATGVAAIAFVALRKKDSIMAAFEEAWPTPEEKQSVLYDPSKAANPAPDANTDASLMASLRDRLLNTGSAPVGEDVEFRPVTDDELDEEQKAVRDQRAAYPAKDGGVGSGLLDRPSGNAPPAPANMLGDAAPAAQAPEMASAESIAFMERMFKAGDGGK